MLVTELQPGVATETEFAQLEEVKRLTLAAALIYYGGHQIGDVAKAGLMESPAPRPIFRMRRGRQLRI
jgi:hypothetical protein